MYTTYHLPSAEAITTDILESIKAAYKSRPIVIVVGEDNGQDIVTTDIEAILEERLQEDEHTYLTAEQSIKQLENKYGL